MALDASISMGKGTDEGIQRSIDGFAGNYAYAENDYQRGSTERAAEKFIDNSISGDNKARADYWTGVYNDKKAKLEDRLSGSQSAAE